MLVYKLKVIPVEDGTLNLFPIIHNTHAYPRVDNNCSDGFGTALPDYG